jgi:hypothetical protein
LSERHELWRLADALQMDLRAASAKMVELRAQLAALDLPEASRVACPRCGIFFAGEHALAVHLYNMHNGTVPQAWVDAESAAS